MGLNRALIGKQYPAQDYGVTAEAVGRYARAYNDDNPPLFEPGPSHSVLAPPMFGVVLGWLPIMMVVTDSELNVDVLRLLHTEQDMRFVLPVVSGDIITSTATLVDIEDKAGGESFTLTVDSTNQRGQLVQHMRLGPSSGANGAGAGVLGHLARHPRRSRCCASPSPSTLTRPTAMPRPRATVIPSTSMRTSPEWPACRAFSSMVCVPWRSPQK